LLLVISVLCFALIQLAPFDAIDMIARPDMAPEVKQALRVRAGLDKSPATQFISWLHRMVSGDLG
jgi:peptide/nickel transport system permease protein